MAGQGQGEGEILISDDDLSVLTVSPLTSQQSDHNNNNVVIATCPRRHTSHQSVTVSLYYLQSCDLPGSVS